MSKKEIELIEIENDFFSPGNIFWKQKSGAEVLISAKGNYLNIEMLKKLSRANHTILIEHGIDLSIHKEIHEVFNLYVNEISIKEKLKHKKILISLLFKYYGNERLTQFDLSQLCWKLFADIPRDLAQKYLEVDFDYFKRTVNLAATHALCALLIGYDDFHYLKEIFNSTVHEFMNLTKSQRMMSLKVKLEEMRLKASFTEDDLTFLTKTFQLDEIKNKHLLFEKFDGTGIQKFNIYDMSDLELVFMTINYANQFDYQFEEVENEENILFQIISEKFLVNKKVLHLMKNALMNSTVAA